MTVTVAPSPDRLRVVTNPELRVLVESDFGAMYQALNACLRIVPHLRGIHLVKTTHAIADLRRALGIPEPDEPAEPWGGIEQYQAESR